MKLLGLSVLILFIKCTQSDSSLKSLHVLFRHGERSPSKSYPNDPHKDYPWSGGWDQLNNRGKLEMYELGQNFRKSYKGFISEYYFPDDVYVLSSYADRCQMSAQLVLAGLFPPIGQQIWNPNLLWQPIPVQSVARSLDNKIALKRRCPSYKKALDAAYTTSEMELIDEENSELYKLLSNNTGSVVHGISNVETLHNILEIEKINGLELPQWTENIFPDRTKDLAAMSLAIFTKTDFMKKMHGGELIKEITANIEKKSNGTLKPDRKLFLYSGHDLTVVSLMRILGFYELIKPEFGASVIIEHRSIDNKDIIKILYKPNPFSESIEKIPYYCDKPCSLKTFVKEMNNYISNDWEEECQQI